MPLTFIELNTEALADVIILMVFIVPIIWWGLFKLWNEEVREEFRTVVQSKFFKKINNKIYFLPFLLFLLFLGGLERIGSHLDVGVVVILLFLLTLFNIRISLDLKNYFYMFFSSAILIAIISCAFGWSIAETSQSYYVLQNVEQDEKEQNVEQGKKEQDYVVLALNQDYAMIAPVNLDRKVIMPSFQTIEVKSEEKNKIEFKYMHTGKLKVKDYTN